MAQLSRARDRSMHSIVATIQAEQDQAIRAPGKGVVSISGGPGTGKTVVALHRAAFLLYSDRRRYEGGGVLVVGPSGVFMRYIERVLPSLGETAVALRSLGEVVGGIRATRHDEPAVADVKGALRMAELLRRTARQHAPGSADRASGSTGATRRSCSTRGLLGRLRRQLMSQGRRNRQLPRVAKTLLDAMWRQVKGERGRDRGREAFDDDMLSHDGFVEFALPWWPPLDALTVLRLAARPRVPLPRRARAWSAARSSCCSPSRGRRASCRSRTCRCSTSCATPSATCRSAPTTSATSTRPACSRAASTSRSSPPSPSASTPPAGWPGRAPTHRIEDDGYAHVLIDEAQDLTPMQWRMVGRRGRTASWTIVGDPAQSSWPDAAGGRPRAGRGARGQGAPRVPPVHQLPQLRGDLRLRRRLRPAGRARRRPARRPYAAPVRSRAVVGPRRRPRGRRARGGHRRPPAGSRAPSASWSRSPAARRSTPGWRRGPSSPTTPPGPAPPSTRAVTPSGEDRVVVLTGLDTKGLEFDGIVVVSPAGDRGRVGHRAGDALRRAHPRDAAADDRRLTAPPDKRRWRHVASPTRIQDHHDTLGRLMSRLARRCAAAVLASAVARCPWWRPWAPAPSPRTRLSPAVRHPRRPLPASRSLPRRRPRRLRSGRPSSSTASTGRRRLAGPVAPHDRLERGRPERAGPARGRAPGPDPLDPRLDPAGGHPGAGLGEPAHAQHRQQLRRPLGPAPRRGRPARDRRDRELRPDEDDGRAAGLAPLLRRDGRRRRQRVRRRRSVRRALARRPGVPRRGGAVGGLLGVRRGVHRRRRPGPVRGAGRLGQPVLRRDLVARPPPGARQRRPRST